MSSLIVTPLLTGPFQPHPQPVFQRANVSRLNHPPRPARQIAATTAPDNTQLRNEASALWEVMMRPA